MLMVQVLLWSVCLCECVCTCEPDFQIRMLILTDVPLGPSGPVAP